jgi:hypothetical protein
MIDAYDSRGASLHQINALAEWIRNSLASVRNGTLDVITLIEIDMPKIFPGLYVEIKSNDIMGNRNAYVHAEPLGIVVSEGVYEKASCGCINSCEIILHEVGHIFLHSKHAHLELNNAYGEYKPQFQRQEAARSAEWQARNFAFCMLFPYSRIKEFRSKLEIAVYLNVSHKLSERIEQHLRKLRLRESERDLKKESKWVSSIIKHVRMVKNLSTDKSGQLEFFHRAGRNEEVDSHTSAY